MNGTPFLSYLIDMLVENGITNIVLLLGYLPEIVIEYLKKNPREGVEIHYMVGDVNWETGTRIKRAEHLLDKDFLLLYSDNYLKINIKNHLFAYQETDADILMTVYRNLDNYSKSNVCFTPDGRVEFYDGTRSDPRCNGIDAGFFILSKRVVEEMPSDDFHLTHDFLPQAIAGMKVRCVVTDQIYYSIGTLERLAVTQEYLRKKKVVVLDRDGVINKKAAKADYVKTVDEFSFLPGAKEAIAQLSNHGYQMFVASNQAGIARNKMTEVDLSVIHEFMNREIEEAGGKISGIYYCPHGWDEECTCRKPKPGLILKASRDHRFQLSDVLFIGDDERDEIAGMAAGCKPVLVNEKNGLVKVASSLIESGIDYTYLLYLILKKKKHKSRVIVAIAGQSRAGKTTIANKLHSDLQKLHGIESQILALDHFILGLDKRPADCTVRERYDYKKISEAVRDIANGASINLPFYDARTRQSSETGSFFSPIKEGVVLIEGTVAIDAIESSQCIDLSVYVTIDEHTRKERLQDFYTNYKGLPRHEVEELIRRRYRDEYPIIHNSIQSADLLVRV